MDKLYFSLILFLISTGISAQTVDFGLQAGIGIYQMQDLKDLTLKVNNELPFQAKIIDNYPPYLYYKSFILISNKGFDTGILATFYSTGSKISLKDYSGEYLFNTKINSIAPGIHIGYNLVTFSGKYNLAIYSEGGIAFSKLYLDEVLTLYEQEITNSSYSFNSKNYYVEPGLKFGFKLYKSFDIEFNMGYFVQFGKDVLKTDKGEVLNDGKNAIGPNWNGLRFGLAIIYSDSQIK